MPFLQKQILILVQALLGVITPNYRMVKLRVKGVKIYIVVTLEFDDDDDLEEIEDLGTEFEILQESKIKYEINTEIRSDVLQWPDDNWRVIYRRKEIGEDVG